MSTAIEKRLTALEFAARRKAPQGVIEDVRAMLEKVDGQHELDMRPGENIFTVGLRRLQVADGWNLDLIPGDTLVDKIKTVDNAANTGVAISPEARHSARHWFEMVEGV